MGEIDQPWVSVRLNEYGYILMRVVELSSWSTYNATFIQHFSVQRELQGQCFQPNIEIFRDTFS